MKKVKEWFLNFDRKLDPISGVGYYGALRKLNMQYFESAVFHIGFATLLLASTDPVANWLSIWFFIGSLLTLRSFFLGRRSLKNFPSFITVLFKKDADLRKDSDGNLYFDKEDVDDVFLWQQGK